jgi:teichuronic acid biosynthesis glycosyltransferase TuaC
VTGSEISAGRSRPLHVLTITPFYPKAGNESGGCFVAEPLAELAKTGVRSTVYAVEPFYRPRALRIASDVKSRWFRYAALPGGLGLSSAGRGLFLRLRRPAERLHALTPIDVIHAHGALPCGDAALRLSETLGIPFVVTVHGLDAFSTRQVPGWAGALCETASTRVYRTARRVISVSQHVCDEVQRGTEGLAASASTVVYNGVDPLLFAPGVDSDPTPDPVQGVVLTVGNLIPTKGHELLLRSLAVLRPEFPALTWEVIGDGPELNRIRELAEQLGMLANVRFRGRQNRATVAEAFRRCTVFALPSSYEGLGCVYLEAMASGKAAIGCLGQGIEEVIRHGENGWLIRTGASEELTQGLRVLLRDALRRARIGRAARETVLQSFTLAHQASALRAVYEESIR